MTRRWTLSSSLHTMLSQGDISLTLFEWACWSSKYKVPQPLRDHQCNTLIFSKRSVGLPLNSLTPKWTRMPRCNMWVQALRRWKPRGGVWKSLLMQGSMASKTSNPAEIVSLVKAMTPKLYSRRYKEYMTTASTVTQQPWSTDVEGY